MDALSEVFRTVSIESTTCYRIELTAPWGLQMSAFKGAVFLVILRGSGWLEVEGMEAHMPLVGGDLVLLLNGQPHALRHAPPERAEESAAQPMIDFERFLETQAEDTSNVFCFDGVGLATTVMYGRFRFTNLPENPLLCASPPLLMIKGEDMSAVAWLETTLQFLASEMVSGRPGAETVINHLASILLAQVLRAYGASRECSDPCWLRALTDPAIGPAMDLIHRHPERLWTVEKLAEQVGVSRTKFFTQFHELVGEPPGKYLTRWRMQRASQALRQKYMTLSEVANLVGYESEASFSKAFKQWMGQSPGAYRKQLLG
ncbi:MAG: AraC family transcriptional regulator [Cyanobacteria bacterium J06639_14]